MLPAALSEVARFLTETPLAEVEELALRLAHLLENRDVAFPSNAEGAAVPLLIAKAITEVTGFASCCRAGSLWAGYHHIRAMIELYAASVHIVVDPDQRAIRLARFHEYDQAAAYREHLLSFETGDNFRRFEVDDSRLALMVEREPYWRALYERKNLRTLRAWHDPVPIKTLLEHCDQLSPDDVGRWRRYYADICNPTHVSPLGHKAVGAHGLPVFAMPRDAAFVRGKVVLVGLLLKAQIDLWDKHYIPTGRLASRTKNWVSRFLSATASTKPEESVL